LGDFCIVSGGFNNDAQPNEFATISGGAENKAKADQSTITGGFGNSICEDCTSGTIVCGQNNTIEGKGSTECTIGAGSRDTINNSPSSTIVGGNKNSIKNSNAGSIGGGQENQVTGDFAVVGGGQQNIASGEGSVIPGGRQNKASGAYSIAFGRRAETEDVRSLVINLQEGGGQLKSKGKSTFSAAAKRFIFQIGNVQAVIDGTSIVELNAAVSNQSRDRRNLRSTHLMTPTRIRELIHEQKMKHEEQHDTVSKLQQELASLVEGEKHQKRGLELEESQEQEDDSGRSLEEAVTGQYNTEEQGKNNMAVGTGSVVNGGEKNTASGSLSVVGGGLKNAASGTMSIVGGGERNKAGGQTAVVAGGKENETEEGFAFIGGGEKNKCLSPVSSVGGGLKNQIKKAAPFSFVGGGLKNKVKGEYGFIGGGEKNQVGAKWASVLGGSKSLATGNYATAMGRNAQANQNLCMAIGLQLNEDKFVRANQVGDWILRAELIELRVDGADKALVLTEKNINKFRSILKGTHRRRLEAKSDEERNLLTELEESEDLVEYQGVVIEELNGNIQDFYRDLHEANEDLFDINSE